MHKIHEIIKKQHPVAVKKVNRMFALRHIKLISFILIIVLTYIIFTNSSVKIWVESLGIYGYFGIFIAGMFLAVGFLAPFSTGFLLISNPENLIFAVFLASLGAMITDLLIFVIIKKTFSKEIKNFEENETIKKINQNLTKNLGIKTTTYLLYVFAGLMIALPLPDEIGVAMLAGLTHIKIKYLAIIALILHAIAVFCILYLGIII